MRVALRRLVGLLLIFISLTGITLGSVAVYQVWQWRQPVVEAIQSNLTLAEEMLDTSRGLLSLVEEALKTVDSQVDILLEALKTLQTMLKDVNPVLGSLEALTGESLPTTIESTQESLESAKASADVIDNIMRVIASIPLIGGPEYNPKVPLSASLEEISVNLGTISPALDEIEEALSTTQGNLEQMDDDLSRITASTRQTKSNLSEAQNIIDAYRDQVSEAQSRLSHASQQAPFWLDRLAWMVTIFIAWVGLTQVGLLVQGFMLLGD
jgi:chromosome segregation ATPase